MINLSIIFLLTGIFIIILVTGIFLYRSDDTYNTIIFTVHKLSSLTLCLFSVKTILSIIKVTDVGSEGNVFIVIGILSLIVLFASGIIMSINKNLSHLLPLVHTVTTFILVISRTVFLLGAIKNDLLSR
jgi:hypothetical protein